MKESINKYLEVSVPDINEFWLGGAETTWDYAKLQKHVDFIYIKVLIGETQYLDKKAVDKYSDVIKRLPLTGRSNSDNSMLPHLSAYVLASTNLLDDAGFDVRDNVLSSIDLDVNSLIDTDTYLPKWPSKWTHHTWRVSHWIGGIPSILLTFSQHDPKKQVPMDLVEKVLNACDSHIIDPVTGLMKAYKSEFIQRIFRFVYQLRHNPNHGDIGGLAHIHWLNHVLSRRYQATDALIDRCIKDLDSYPFLERVPYCLDFDYVQLLRTSLEQAPHKKNPFILNRISDFNRDVSGFLKNIKSENYTLHKLPGALATLHETNIILERDYVEGLDLPPVDIIKKANWL